MQPAGVRFGVIGDGSDFLAQNPVYRGNDVLYILLPGNQFWAFLTLIVLATVDISILAPRGGSDW